jgi:two-component system sensor histidine kinase BaeS
VASERWRRRRALGCFGVVAVVALVVVLAVPWWHGGPVLILWVLAALLVLVLGRWIIRLARATSRPVDELIDAAGRVQAGDYTARVSEQGPAEIRSLARAFNQMSDRLERTDTQRRSFMADVSHELRTPLTVIQGQLEAIRDGVYPADAEHVGPALEQVAVLERLVGDLRTLSLSESGSLPLARERVDLASLAGDVVAGFRSAATTAGISLSVQAEPATPAVLVDPARIGSLLRNLVANALRYTPPGGSVTVRLRQAGAHVEMQVQDTGPGIDPALLPTVFERFSRSADSAGSGLGLAIARAIVEAHGGTIAAASTPGQGTSITVRLPIDGA